MAHRACGYRVASKPSSHNGMGHAKAGGGKGPAKEEEGMGGLLGKYLCHFSSRKSSTD